MSDREIRRLQRDQDERAARALARTGLDRIRCWCGVTANRPHYPGNDPENGPAHDPSEFQCDRCEDTGYHLEETSTDPENGPSADDLDYVVCDCGQADHDPACDCVECRNERTLQALYDRLDNRE